MRILLIHSFWLPRGGDSTYALGLARALADVGHEVAFFCERWPGTPPSALEGFFPAPVDVGALEGRRDPRAVWTVLSKVIYNLPARRGLAGLLREWRPDVAHLHHVHHHLTPSVLDALGSAGVPAVWTLHDYELLCPTGHFFRDGRVCEDCKGGHFEQAIRHRCERGSAAASAVAALEKTIHRWMDLPRRVGRLLAPSAFLASKLVEYGIPGEKVSHLPNFVSVGPAPPPPGEGVVYVGRLSPEKGVEHLIDAARRLPGLRFLVVGDGPSAADLRRRAGDLPHVEFAGRLAPEGVAAALEGARVAVVPSVWYENFPYAALEAMERGRPVVASQIGGLTEIVAPGIRGELAPPGDSTSLARAITLLHGDVRACERLGRAGRRWVEENLGVESHLRCLTRVYGEIIQGGDPRREGV